MHEPRRAIIYLPHDAQLWLPRCLELITHHGLQLHALTYHWHDVEALIRRPVDPIDDVIAGTRAHLPPQRRPRLLIADEHGLPTPPGQRRPRRLPGG